MLKIFRKDEYPDVLWAAKAQREQPDRAMVYSLGKLTLTQSEIRYDLRWPSRLYGSRFFGAGTQLLGSDSWHANIKEIGSIEVVDRLPVAPRMPRQRLRIGLVGGGEELFDIEDPDTAATSLREAIRRLREAH
jgi:hypothetical protein